MKNFFNKAFNFLLDNFLALFGIWYMIQAGLNADNSEKFGLYALGGIISYSFQIIIDELRARRKQ